MESLQNIDLEIINETKLEVAAATRILAREKMIGPFGHPSARIPGTDVVAILGDTHFSVKLLTEVTEDDIALIDLDGEPLNPNITGPGERFIHTQIYRARPDVSAVVHAHPVYCIAFSVVDRPLLPLWHLCTEVSQGVPVHMKSIQIDTPELADELADLLGDRAFVLLHAHGSVAVGESMATACVRSISLERSARLQSVAETLGKMTPIDAKELSAAGVSQGLTQDEINAQWDYWKLEAF
jgi:ribulose-5-phosphate 4-epimerase/fuculose-1-phosphate aldolase